jgi:hypothetical protein
MIIKNKNSKDTEISNIFYEMVKKAMSTNTLLYWSKIKVWKICILNNIFYIFSLSVSKKYPFL